MEENEKPFACMIDGCSMRFMNEDHLTVHKKKHDMILNLGIGQKPNMFVDDQTPTPTRFIRNCEEVGLFQDLQVNPFEETFRKAVEAGKSGNQPFYLDSLHVPAGTDDTLHTPHVFPYPHHNDDASLYKSGGAAAQESGKRKHSDDQVVQSGSSDSCSDPITAQETYRRNGEPATDVTEPDCKVININGGTGTSRLAVRPTESLTVLEKKKETLSVAGQSMQLLLRMPDGQLVQLVQENHPKQLPPLNGTPIPTPENGLALAKMKLKQALTNNGRVTSSSAVVDSPKVASKVRSSIEQPLSPTPSPQSSHSTRESAGSGGEPGEEGTERKRERNRAAAMRCREKRKTWVQELERRADVMHLTNQQLQGEVTTLRAEVATLKTLLLAHKYCPVTQAMNNAQLINVSSLPVKTIQTCLQPTTQPSRIAFQSTATTSKPPTVILSKPPTDKKAIAPLNSPKRKRLNDNVPIVEANNLHKISLPPLNKPNASNRLLVNGRNIPSVVVTSHCSNQPQVASLPSQSATYASVKHLLSACASNENNLNMEKSSAMMSRFNNEDEEESEVLVERGIGIESKVIKLNPNAIRFRNVDEFISREQTHMTGGSAIVEMVVLEDDSVEELKSDEDS